MSEYQTGTYVKGDQPPRQATTPREAVALVFEGYKFQEDVEPAQEAAVDAPETPADPQPAQPQAPAKKKD